MSKITYKDSGVDIGANTRWVAAIEAAMRSTYGPRVVQDRHGGFAGMFKLELDGRVCDDLRLHNRLGRTFLRAVHGVYVQLLVVRALAVPTAQETREALGELWIRSAPPQPVAVS